MGISEPGQGIGGLPPSPSKERPGAASQERPRSGSSSSAHLTPTSWSCNTTHSLDLREWSEHGRRLGGIGRAVAWWIGDWLRYGNVQFGERYARASRITGYDVQTLMNMVYVATHFEISQRRENLSWSHHAEVCALPADERERWLELAQREHLSVRCLREELRRVRRLASDRSAPDDDRSPRLAAPQAHGEQDADLARNGVANQERICPECGTLLTGDTPTRLRRRIVSRRP
ncbi:MAG TPA: hypothetical protein VNV42_01125 [Solirubrobacteraceae bacterium]|jgi:hypothetical protein|nr:hypothetical protein [Solirubrobacteraceae bacterium]